MERYPTTLYKTPHLEAVSTVNSRHTKEHIHLTQTHTWITKHVLRMYNGLRMATMLRPSQNRLKESQAMQLCCNTNRHSRAASSRIVCVNLGSEEERRINKINWMEAAIGISILRHCSELKTSTGSPIPTQTLNSYGNVFLNHCHRHE